jgi:hypothetical protein
MPKRGPSLAPPPATQRALRAGARWLLMLTPMLAPALAQAFSQGSPICEVNGLPLQEMSPTLASPPPAGWKLRVPGAAYMAERPLRVRITHPNPAVRARGILLWAKAGPFSGAGHFLADTGMFQYVPAPADCGLWALSHTDAEPKPLADLGFWWLPPASGVVVMRAFVIQDCDAPAGCRDQQALTPLLVLEPKLFFDSFESED